MRAPAVVAPRALEDYAPLAFALAQRVGLIRADQPLPPRPTAITVSTAALGTVAVWLWDSGSAVPCASSGTTAVMWVGP